MRLLKKSAQLIFVLLLAQFIIIYFHFQFYFQDVLSYTSNYWQNYMFNIVVLYVFYLCCLVICNRQKYALYWFFTGIFLFAIANYLKLGYRNEPLLPSDFSQILELVHIIQMMNEFHVMLILVAIGLLIVTFLVLIKIKSKLIFTKNQRRGVALFLSVVLFSMYHSNLPYSPYKITATALGMTDIFWDVTEDYSINGPLVGFIKKLNIKVMDEPEDYSYETVKAIVEKYKEKAIETNKGKGTLEDHTVIFILSESFVDPSRIPSLKLSDNPIPYIRSLTDDTTSGLIVGSGYGGGTANVEYEILTGFSTNYLHSSLRIPYTLLVPNLNEAPNFTDIFQYKTAVHTYNASLYKREEVFQKFGFERFLYDGSRPDLTYKEAIENSEYISDESAYQEVLDILHSSDHDSNLFLLLTTMQNHIPYQSGQYTNQFQVLNEIDEQIKSPIETYVQGLHYTDIATENFIEEINNIDKPITVVFFGDHLPSDIFDHFAEDNDSDLAFYKTDYFIYSNFETTELDYPLVSPNILSSIVLEQLNIQQSPYYAMLEEVKKTIPVIRWGEYLLQSNELFVYEYELPESVQELVNDYRIIQYDINAGEQYSIDLGMFEIEP